MWAYLATGGLWEKQRLAIVSRATTPAGEGHRT
jgi:hypothetical protein